MTVFQLLMLGASAYFAFKIYEHIQTLQDPEQTQDIKSKIQDIDIFIKEGDELREKGEYDRALAAYMEAKTAQGENAEVLFKIGYTMALSHRYDEALEYFEDSLKYDDKNPFAYLEISKIYKKLDNEEKADYYYKKAVELDEDIRDL